MCTIGAIIFNPKDYLLFKNKDFAGGRYDDRLEVNQDWFGPLGLETFAEGAETPPVYSGLSIGANRHGLLVCVNHVKITGPQGRNYDLLVQDALESAKDVPSALSLLQSIVDQQDHWWGNLVLTGWARRPCRRGTRSGSTVRTPQRAHFSRQPPAPLRRNHLK
ncbi:MAG: hypothetical protein AAF530_20100 [Pseudomonadota bacterium]